MSDENMATYCYAWYELDMHGAMVEDCHLGGYDDLYPNDEMGGES